MYLCFLILFHDGVELDKLALMILAVVDELGHFLTYRLDIVETWQCHVTIQIGGGGAWVNRENLYWGVALLELDGHHTHHGILGGLAGYVG